MKWEPGFKDCFFTFVNLCRYALVACYWKVGEAAKAEVGLCTLN
jgi:hypothetical protein